MFIGANLLFFPMHFMGIAGMPRRIPDYSIIYLALNQISSLGMILVTISIEIFLIICLTIQDRI